MTHRVFLHQDPTFLTRHFQAAQSKLDPQKGANPAWAKAMLAHVEADAKALARQVLSWHESPQSTPTTVSVSDVELDQYVGLHLDRWIETAAHHASLYAGVGYAPHPTVQTPRYVPLALAQSLSEAKSLSGDISGAVGEGLFVSLIRKAYGHGPDDFVHLRPTSVKRFPDFAVIRPTASFWSLIHGGALAPAPWAMYVPIETKTISKAERPSQLSGSIRDALVQLLSFWMSVGWHTQAGPSGLFLAIRNRRRQSYDLVLVHGQ